MWKAFFCLYVLVERWFSVGLIDVYVCNLFLCVMRVPPAVFIRWAHSSCNMSTVGVVFMVHHFGIDCPVDARIPAAAAVS